jgi:HK97 family phage major capsid protein
MKHTRNRGPLNLQYERKSSGGGGGDAGEAVLEVKKLVEAIGRGFEEYKSTNDALIKAKADGKVISDFEAKLDKIETDLGKWTEAKSQIDAMLTKLNRPGASGGEGKDVLEKEVKSFNDMRRAGRVQGADKADATPEEYEQYKHAFWEYQRKGNIDWLEQADRKAMSVGTDADGGYLVPAPTVGRVAQKVYDLSPIRQIANVMSISGDALEGVNDLDEASYGWVGEQGTRSDTNTPQVGKYRIEAHEMYAQPKATQKLLDDAAVDIEAWLQNKVATRFARAEGAAFITGTGLGTPRGFASYSTAATGDSTRDWGVMEHVVTGASGDFAASTPADILFDLIAAFKQEYLQNARWVTRREVIAKIRKFKEATTNAYMWQPGLQAGQPDRLLGYPITMAQDMPTLAANSLSMAFGDFMEGYQVVDRIGMRTLRDPYTDKPFIKFYTTRRVGGAVVNFEAIKFLKFST